MIRQTAFSSKAEKGNNKSVESTLKAVWAAAMPAGKSARSKKAGASKSLISQKTDHGLGVEYEDLYGFIHPWAVPDRVE